MRHDGRSTRIVATLGPATESAEEIQRLVGAGLDVARLNMSHGDRAFHEKVARRVRRAARDAERPIGIMADLQGPKLRLGPFEGPVETRRGQTLALTTRRSETDTGKPLLPVDYKQLPNETAAGHEILLADGLVRARVRSVRGHRVTCEILEGGCLTARAGLHLPQATPSCSAMTAKDKRDLKLAVEIGVDIVALSFVRRAGDMRELRRHVKRLGGDQLTVAKIETTQAVDALDDVIAESDALMVARGDLGVELPPERVPATQKTIIRDTVAAGKPVITATEMLESMRSQSRPTRAEASDVANAVLDGSWAVMLSAETATGRYPARTVSMMSKIAYEAEELLLRQTRIRSSFAAPTVSEGIAQAAARLSLDVGAEAIITLTRSGATARQMARFLLPVPIIAYTPSARALQRMTLYRGILPRRLGEQRGLESAIRRIAEDLLERRDVRRGDLIVVIGGAPDQTMGVTDRLAVVRV